MKIHYPRRPYGKTNLPLTDLAEIVSQPEEYKKKKLASWKEAVEYAKRYAKAREAKNQLEKKLEEFLKAERIRVIELNEKYKLKVSPPTNIGPTIQDLREAREQEQTAMRDGYDGMYTPVTPKDSYDKTQDQYLEEIYHAFKKSSHGNKAPSWEEYRENIKKQENAIISQINACDKELFITRSFDQPSQNYPDELDTFLATVEKAKPAFEIEFERSDFDEQGDLKAEVKTKITEAKLTIPNLMQEQEAFKVLLAIDKTCEQTIKEFKKKKGLTDKQYCLIYEIKRISYFDPDSKKPSETLLRILDHIEKFPTDDMSSKFIKFINQIKKYCETFISHISKKGVSASQAHAASRKEMGHILTSSEKFRTTLKDKIDETKINEGNQDTSFKP